VTHSNRTILKNCISIQIYMLYIAIGLHELSKAKNRREWLRNSHLHPGSMRRLHIRYWFILNRNLEELIPGNTASRNHKLFLQGITPLPRMPHRKPGPICETNKRQTKCRNGMRPIWQVLIDHSSFARWYKRHDQQ